MHIWWGGTEALTQAKAVDWCKLKTKLKWSFTWSRSRDPAASLINPNHHRRCQMVNKLSHLTPTKRLWSKGLDALIWQLKHYCSLTRTPGSVKWKQQVASHLLPGSLLHFHLFHSAAAPLCWAQRCQLGPPCRSRRDRGWWRGLGRGCGGGDLVLPENSELRSPSVQLKMRLTCEKREVGKKGVDVGPTQVLLLRQAPAAKSHPPWDQHSVWSCRADLGISLLWWIPAAATHTLIRIVFVGNEMEEKQGRDQCCTTLPGLSGRCRELYSLHPLQLSASSTRSRAAGSCLCC